MLNLPSLPHTDLVLEEPRSYPYSQPYTTDSPYPYMGWWGSIVTSLFNAGRVHMTAWKKKMSKLVWMKWRHLRHIIIYEWNDVTYAIWWLGNRNAKQKKKNVRCRENTIETKTFRIAFRLLHVTKSVLLISLSWPHTNFGYYLRIHVAKDGKRPSLPQAYSVSRLELV